MNTTLIPFDFYSNPVRVIEQDGEAWFVLDDVAKALGYSRSRDAAKYLDDDEKGATICRTLGGDQSMVTVNESGIYHLAIKSRKPAARMFRKWVTGEVLPAIRKTGSYAARSRDYHFPLSAADPHDRHPAILNAMLTPRVLLDPYNRALELELLELLEEDGHDVSGVRVRIEALRHAAGQAAELRRLMRRLSEELGYAGEERGRNVRFAEPKAGPALPGKPPRRGGPQ